MHLTKYEIGFDQTAYDMLFDIYVGNPAKKELPPSLFDGSIWVQLVCFKFASNMLTSTIIIFSLR